MRPHGGARTGTAILSCRRVCSALDQAGWGGGGEVAAGLEESTEFPPEAREFRSRLPHSAQIAKEREKLWAGARSLSTTDAVLTLE